MRDIIGHGGGKGGGSSHTHYEAPDSLHSTSYARVLDLVSEGEILGLAEGLQSVYLNDTPVQNADGTSNFQGITVDFRTGTQAQDYIPGFPDVESETTVGVELKYGTPWVRAISNTALSAVRITLGVDQLYKADTNNGDVGGSIVRYAVELSTDGGAYQTVLSNSFNGKTMSAYQRSARIDLPRATTGWQIRVSRLTPNSTVVSIVDKTTIISFTEVIDAKLRYPMSAIVGVQVDAKQFQSVPTRAYDLFGRIIQVPSNYDPRTRAYSGTWDGTFKPSWSDNPAWVFRDLALNDRYGLGNRITAAQLDKWALYKIARYCDELVPDGKGGTEPRFTCNLYLQTRKQAYAVLQDIASIFRGISYWGAGTIMASADMPADPVYVYTAANVIGGKFTRTGTKKATRYTVALVTWNDPADGYKPKVEYVEDREGIARYGIQQTELTAFGCTSQGQAHRAGRWALATSRLETEGITFDVGMDGAIALPGQIVRIADPSRMGRRVGGRVRAVAGRTITLDKAPTVNAGDRFTVMMPGGTSETRTVAAVAGDAVTVDSDWTTAPRTQAVWAVDSNELSAPLFRVLSVTEKDSITFTITAVQHEPGKYDFVERGTAITPRTQTALDVTRQAPPASVTLAGYTVSLADVQKLALQVSCAPVAGAVAYEGAYRRGNDNWVAIPRQPSPTMDVLDILPGAYMAKMAAVNSIGVTSVETQSLAVEIARDGASKNAKVDVSSDAPYFHTDQAGNTDPLAITFTADLTALEGPVAWTCVGGTLTNKTATTAQLTFANATAASATVTATVTSFGRTYTRDLKVGKVQDGKAGTDGLKTALARLFQWAPVAPARPAGTSTFTWASLSNGAYTGSDGWSISVPANPGTPGWRLFSAVAALSAAASAATSPVSYTNATVEDGAQNGANGMNGLQSETAIVYQWAATIPAPPAGNASFDWATRSFGSAPAGWSLTPGTSPTAGSTQWAAKVLIRDTAGASTTAFNWGGASITAAGYAGLNGTASAYVVISNNGQVFSRASSAAAFAPASITLTATPYGGSATYQWQYWTGSAWTNVASAGTSATYAVAPGDFTDTRTYRVRATIGSTVYTDEITLVQVTGGVAGQNAITPVLTNESATLAATTAGVVTDFSGASGTFMVFDGVTDKTGAAVTYSVASQTGCTVSINAAGVYSVSAMSADQASATLQAAYGGVTLRKTLSLSKARAGTTGDSGATGASFVVAYCVTTTATASGAPAPTTGKTSLPAANSSGLAGTWASNAPASVPAGSYLFQSSGIYNPTTNTITWDVPYWSYAKFASLSAITANMGAITAGSMDIGTGATSWHVDASGNQWAGAATYAAAPYQLGSNGALTVSSLTVKRKSDGAVILTSDGLTSAGAAPGTLNIDLAPDIAAAAANTSLALPIEGDSGWSGGTLLSLTTAGDGKVGQTVRRSRWVGDIAEGTTFTAIDRTRIYRTRFWARAAAGTVGTLYHDLRQYTAPDASKPNSGNQGRSPYKPGGQAPHTDWREYNFTWTAADWQAGTTHVKPDFLLNYAGTSGAGYWEVQGYSFTDVTDSYTSASKGAALNDDPNIENVTAWVLSDTVNISGTSRTDAVGSNYFSCSSGTDKYATTKRRFAVDASKVYNLTAMLYTDSGNNRNIYIFVNFYDRNGAKLATSWGAAMSGYTYGGIPPAGAWSRQGAMFGGSSTGKPIPAGTVAAEIGVWFQYSGTGSTAVTQGAQDIRIEEVTLAAQALGALPGMNDQIASKISKTTASILSAGITLQSSGAIVAGTASYSSAGYGGTGTVMSPFGFACVLNGVPKFAVSSSGDVYFAGQLWGVYGTLGSLTLAPGGNVRSSNSNGWGTWPDAGQAGLMYLGAEGLQLGNYNSNRFIHAYANGNLFMPGFSMQDGQLTLTNPVIIAPKLQTTLSVNIPLQQLRNVGGSSVTWGFSPVVSGGSGAVARYLWSFTARDGASPITMVSSPSDSSVTLRATGAGWKYGYISLTIYDTNGAVASASQEVSVQFGSAVEP